MQETPYHFHQEEEESVFDLQHYIGIIQRRIWWLVTIALISFSLCMIHLIKSIPIYRAESLVRIAENAYESTILDELTQSGKVTKDVFETQCEILKSNTILTMVAEKLGNDSMYTYARLQANLTVKPIANTFLAKIAYDSPDPEHAARVANLVPQCYLEWQHNEQEAVSENALQWLHHELNDLRDNASDKYSEIEKYSKANTVTISVEALKIEREQAAQEYIQAKMHCLELQRNFNQLKTLLAGNDTLPSIPLSLLNKKIIELQQMKSTKEIELANARNIYKSKHPKIIELKTEIQTIHKNLIDALTERKKEFEIAYAFSREKERELFEHLKEIEKNISEKELENLKMKKMEKDLETSTDLYDVLLKKSKKAEIGITNLLSHFSIIDNATVPQKPYKPKVPSTIFISLLISLLLGLAVIFIIDYIDTTISTREDVVHKLDLKCLGVIPYTKEKDDHNLIGFEECDLILNESFKGLDTNIQLLSSDTQKIRRILFTSTHAKEGKTFIISNLACKIAQSNKKVVVVDTDFYSRGLSKNFNAEKKPGLSDILKQGIDVMDCIIPSAYKNVSVLSCGNSVLESSILSYKTQINEIFSTLKRTFDLLFIDAPPSNITADIFAFAKDTDGVIFVINSQKTYLHFIKKRVAQLKEQKIHILGVVLNYAKRFSLKDDYYSYYYKRNKT